MNMRTNVVVLLAAGMVRMNAVAATVIPASEIRKIATAQLAKFNTRELKGAFGLDVDVYYPDVMKFETGGFQSHTVGKASYEWNDYEMLVQIMLGVFNPGKEAIRELNEAIAGITDKKEIGGFLPTGATFIDAGVTSIRDTKVIWCESENRMERMGESNWGMSRMYMIPADSGYLLNLQFSVSCVTGKSPKADFDALRKVFAKCAVALTLKDYSQFNSKVPKIVNPETVSPHVRTSTPTCGIATKAKSGSVSSPDAAKVARKPMNKNKE